ncbi:MAG: hypothetical protein WKF43_02185 [Acidimicrobiales bacterium]
MAVEPGGRLLAGVRVEGVTCAADEPVPVALDVHGRGGEARSVSAWSGDVVVRAGGRRSPSRSGSPGTA